MAKYRITINEDYTDISEFIGNIPSVFDTLGEDIYIGRNLIKKIAVNGIPLNVKRFRTPIFINRIVYSFFRKSKAYKAYHNAQRVIGKGISTPIPISFIEEFKSGLISYSYFISSQLEGYRETRDFYYSKVESDEECQFLKAFALFSAQLHELNILHLDYSPGNILYSRQEDGSYSFSIVDINRMEFREIDIKKGCENFARLFENDSVYKFIAPHYARARGFDEELCKNLLIIEKQNFTKRNTVRRN